MTDHTRNSRQSCLANLAYNIKRFVWLSGNATPA
jgi:hypothetical protein